MHTVAPVAPSQRISRSVRQRGGYAGKRRDWSHPRVHISHSLIGRGVLLLGVRPPLMNRWVRREDGGDNKSHSYICAVFVAFLSFAPFCRNDDVSIMDYSFSGINTVKTQ